MRKRTGARIRRNAIRIVLAFLVVLALAVSGLFAYLWHDNDRDGSLAALAIVPTIALAFAAALAYQQNARLVRAVIREATDTRNQALASRQQATASREAVEEMRRERQWAYKPALVIVGATRPSVAGVPAQYRGVNQPTLVVRNIGTGPALNVKLAVHAFSMEEKRHVWLAASWPGVAAGSYEQVDLNLQHDAPGALKPYRYRCIVDEWQVGFGQQVWAVRYEDWFGTHYRSGGPPGHKPDEWRGNPSEMDAPDWVRCEQGRQG